MSDLIKISELIKLPVSSISGDDYFPLVDSASKTTYRTDLTDFNTWLAASGSSISASYALTSSYSNYSGYAWSGYYVFRSVNAGYADFAGIADTASIALTASYAHNLVGNAPIADYATNAGHSVLSDLATNATNATNAIFSDMAISAAYADTAAYAINAGLATVATTAFSATNASYSDFSGIADYALNADTAAYALNASHADSADRAKVADSLSSTAADADLASLKKGMYYVYLDYPVIPSVNPVTFDMNDIYGDSTNVKVNKNLPMLIWMWGGGGGSGGSIGASGLYDGGGGGGGAAVHMNLTPNDIALADSSRYLYFTIGKGGLGGNGGSMAATNGQKGGDTYGNYTVGGTIIHSSVIAGGGQGGLYNSAGGQYPLGGAGGVATTNVSYRQDSSHAGRKGRKGDKENYTYGGQGGDAGDLMTFCGGKGGIPPQWVSEFNAGEVPGGGGGGTAQGQNGTSGGNGRVIVGCYIDVTSISESPNPVLTPDTTPTPTPTPGPSTVQYMTWRVGFKIVNSTAAAAGIVEAEFSYDSATGGSDTVTFSVTVSEGEIGIKNSTLCLPYDATNWVKLSESIPGMTLLDDPPKRLSTTCTP
jgi:hypothetical protein